MTVFEKLSYVGGILTYGIPQFVLPNSVVDREIETLKARGVEICTGQRHRQGQERGRPVCRWL